MVIILSWVQTEKTRYFYAQRVIDPPLPDKLNSETTCAELCIAQNMLSANDVTKMTTLIFENVMRI